MPANTGPAGAMHRVAFFAVTPAPTRSPQPSTQPQYLWERVHPRTPAKPVPYTALDSSQVSQTATPPRRTTSEPANQNTDHPIRELSNSSAAIPARELPAAFNSGDHTHTVNCPGTMATIPPPTPLLPGNPTR